MFEINDKVVCVGSFSNAMNMIDVPAKGSVYVVRDVSGPWPDGYLGLRLTGMISRINDEGMETWYCSSKFRKLSDIQAENAARRANVLHA